MEDARLHHSHPEIAVRLRRAEGHLRSVVAMIGSGRSCLEIATQIRAVERAVAQARRKLIEDHLEHCVVRAAAPLDADAIRELDEFRQIARFL